VVYLHKLRLPNAYLAAIVRNSAMLVITDSNTNPRGTFHFFPLLPAEIRLQVWSHTCRTPPIVRIQNDAAGLTKTVLRHIPAILHVCIESRIHAQKVYSLLLAVPSRVSYPIIGFEARPSSLYHTSGPQYWIRRPVFGLLSPQIHHPPLRLRVPPEMQNVHDVLCQKNPVS
jgi:hypothetical protein